MALILSTKFKGVTAEYYKIVLLNQDITQQKAAVRVGLYLDKGSRDADISNALSYCDFQLDGVDLMRKDVYVLLKALPQFDGAQDA